MRNARVRKAVSRRCCARVERGELRLLEDLAVGQELDRGAVAFGRADGLHVALRDAARELLPVEHPVAAHLGDEPLGERVDDGDTDAVEAAGDLVAVAAELAAGVELREHDRECGQALILDHVDRDAGALVDDGDRVVGVDRDVDACRFGRRAPRRRRCRRPRRRGGAAREDLSFRCTSRGGAGPARGLPGP